MEKNSGVEGLSRHVANRELTPKGKSSLDRKQIFYGASQVYTTRNHSRDVISPLKRMRQ